MDRLAAVKARLDEYTMLSSMLQSDPQNVVRDGKVTVYLGDGYFADLPLDRAIDFIERRRKTLAYELASIQETHGVNEEGLPMMEIMEELDEDGNVVNSTVERHGNALEQMRQKFEQQQLKDKEQDALKHKPNAHPHAVPKAPEGHPIATPHALKSGPGPSEASKGVPKSALKSTKPGPKPGPKPILRASSDSRITELPSESPEPSKSVPQVVPQSAPSAPAAPKEMTPEERIGTETVHGVSREDMLELQLLQEEMDDLQGSDEDMAQELDHLDFEDDDEDEDEESDEDEFGRTRGSMFPQNSRINDLLRCQFASKDSSKQTQKPSTKPAEVKEAPKEPGKKSVRFSNSLDVHEFETSSDERKGRIDPPPKVSRFKQQLGKGQNVKEAQEDDKMSDESALSDVQERPAVSSVQERPAVSSVQERPVTSTVQEKDVNPVKGDPERVSEVIERPSSIFNERRPPPNTSGSQPYSRRYQVPDTKPRAEKIPSPKVPTVDPRFAGTGDVRDEDAPKISDLQDDALKYFDEATIPDDQFLDLHDDMDDYDAPEETPNRPRTDSRPVMGAVAERDAAAGPSEHMSESAQDMNEIRQDYQRLRQKLIYKAGGYVKTDNDQETEPVDQDGNPTKMSRFKAARLGMR